MSKYCIVPKCTSTDKNSPNKLFFSVPSNPKRRNLWFKAIRRLPSDISLKTNCRVCEDHFNLEADLENYVQFKYYNSKRKILKSEVVPHIFDCQTDRPTAHSAAPRKPSLKRKRKEMISDLILTNPTTQDVLQNEASASVEHEELEMEHDEHEMSCAEALCYLKSSFTAKFINQSTQTEKAEGQKSVQCNLCCDSMKAAFSVSSSSSINETVSTSFTWSKSSGSWEITDQFDENEEMKMVCLKGTLYVIERNPKSYLGIPKQCFHIVGILSNALKCDKIKIYTVLSKIRKNYTFEDIADKFGLSPSYISKIFSKYAVEIAHLLKKFVFWPASKNILENMPISFRSNYTKVESILDCLEIEIEQPSDPILQTLTWSQYKKCNTIKYLVSATPNGFINFVSSGYGGRTTDAEILRQSGILQVIPKSSWVMADRGFKGIATDLELIGSHLVRPPSVSAGEKLSRKEVLHSKQIASLRIHIERVIRRLREFKFIKPHACVNVNLVKYLDSAMLIAASLNNIQGNIINV